MKEKPILFSAPMVRAILDGQKTQTRRIVKDQRNFSEDGKQYWHGFWGWLPASDECVKRPYSPGDTLWVRETWGAWPHQNGGIQEASLRFAASDTPPEDPNKAWRWRPSIHMPRSICRIFLEVTAVRVERLNDMSEADAVSEGAVHWWGSMSYIEQFAAYSGGRGPVAAFRALWESIGVLVNEADRIRDARMVATIPRTNRELQVEVQEAQTAKAQTPEADETANCANP